MIKTYLLCDIQKKEFNSKTPRPGAYVSFHDYMSMIDTYNDLKFTAELYGGKKIMEKLKRFPKIKVRGYRCNP